jgi:hypothetical protein
MKRGKTNNIILFFFIMWGVGFILFLTNNINYDLDKVIVFSLGISIILTILYIFLRKPVTLLYRRNFDKYYKYNTERSKKK